MHRISLLIETAYSLSNMPVSSLSDIHYSFKYPGHQATLWFFKMCVLCEAPLKGHSMHRYLYSKIISPVSPFLSFLAYD